MPKIAERSHLRLLRPEDLLDRTFVPLESLVLGRHQQLALFPRPEPTIAVFAWVTGLSDSSFDRLLRLLHPRFVVDVRVSPRFNIGRLNRRSAFALFDTLKVLYFDVAALSGQAGGTAFEDFLRAQATKENFGGPLLVLSESMFECESLMRHAANVLPTHESWQFVPFPVQQSPDAR